MSANADVLLFEVFPYVAIALAVILGVIRYRTNSYSVSSLSSQFLESRRLFWGTMSFHWGILIVLAGHLIGLLFPRSVMAFNAVPVRLAILEGTALAFGLLALLGIVLLCGRRASSARIRVVTSRWDVVLLAILFVQIATGVFTAVFYRWGSAWYVHTAVPYLVSLGRLSPDVALVASLPFMVKLHIASAFGLIAVLPMTRLIHLLAVPVAYLWRPYQLVVWNRRPVTLKDRN
jgi:nitrate reductase gamma subunit